LEALIINKRKIKMAFKIQPLLDRVIIERIGGVTRIGAIYLPELSQERASEGYVVAVGTGKELRDGTTRPLMVSIGDRVIFEKMGPTDLKVDGKEYALVREDQIFAVVAPEALQEGAAPVISVGWGPPPQ
jgi:chaperonin GroES